jgi:hypothetical protein
MEINSGGKYTAQDISAQGFIFYSGKKTLPTEIFTKLSKNSWNKRKCMLKKNIYFFNERI